MTSSPRLPEWLKQLYPFTPGAFTTPAGARMSYLDEGPRSDEAVLMLHGNPTWSFYYRELVLALAKNRRCIVPDHIGMGLSEKPEDYAYTLETRIADIEALVLSLGLKRVHLAVHDWGGAIGFGFAARHPGLIGRILILNTAAFCMELIPARIRLCKLPVAGPIIVRAFNGFAWPATWMAMSRCTLTTDEKRAFLLPYDSWANRVAVSAFVRDIPLQPSHPTWKTLKDVENGLEQFRDRPVSILWGGKDFCFNDAFLARWRQFLPGAKVHRFEDAGHYVLADAREDVVPRAVRFLSAEGG
ncbi:MAG TPA: alpha/beta fold hydrolase [Opitutus sp.]|nr:alpha/beta fold hydrolase [Opitutus sp.]